MTSPLLYDGAEAMKMLESVMLGSSSSTAVTSTVAVVSPAAMVTVWGNVKRFWFSLVSVTVIGWAEAGWR